MMRETDFERAEAMEGFPSPLGTLWLAATRKGICAISFRAPKGAPTRAGGKENADARKNLKNVSAELSRYFAARTESSRKFRSTPPERSFSSASWRALREDSRAGQTRSYGEIARRIGRPKAVRAVGAANGSNPVAIVVPCHRVIGANGTLTGYGGGLEKKEWLLKHEGAGGATLPF